MDQKEFTTSWDTLSRMISGLLIGFIGLFSIYLIIVGYQGYIYVHEIMIVQSLVGLFLPFILLAEYLLAPRKYLVTEHGVVVIRYLHTLLIPFEAIESARETSREEVFSDSTRDGGSGGCFGYYGHFKNPVLGRFLIYATHRYRLVLITLHKGEPVVLSPDEVHEFIDAVEEGIVESNSKVA